MTFLRRLMALLCLCWLPAACVQAEPFKIVASIKPLALIAREVAGPDASVETLLPPGVSPHEFAMTVSDRQALNQADLVLWVGPQLELFLQKSLQRRSSDSVLTVARLDGLHWPAGGGGQSHGHGHKGERDPHLWLNPDNTVVVARALADALAAVAPHRSAGFAQRSEVFRAQLAELDQHWREALAPVADRGFAVYHDGYRHLVNHYGLNQVDYVSVTPERRPGAKHLYELEQTLADSAVCLFVEPYADTDAARALARRLGLRVGMLDPLAADESVTDFSALMQSLVNALSACLLGQLQGDASVA